MDTFSRVVNYSYPILQRYPGSLEKNKGAGGGREKITTILKTKSNSLPLYANIIGYLYITWSNSSNGMCSVSFDMNASERNHNSEYQRYGTGSHFSIKITQFRKLKKLKNKNSGFGKNVKHSLRRKKKFENK